jgi:Mannosylglycerate hydrolase MGH1-like glycoside hydrolase domain
MAMTAEHRRLAEIASGKADWQRWGTYVSDRAWGTVREDYSADGNAWDYFPHDHARSRAYRWNEDAIAGFCDRGQHLCLGVALWNGRDPILKERMFGLSNREGNHGEDVKEYFFYLDNTPTHSYAKMLYKYPQVAYPYSDLVGENIRRGSREPEYELFDAIGDAFRDGRYFDVFVEYAKAGVEDILCRIRVVNRGPEAAPIHVLPHLWYRNTWSWQLGAQRSAIEAVGPGIASTNHPELGERWWYVRADNGANVELLFVENDTNAERLFGAPNGTPFVKDGINDAVVLGHRECVNHERGSKAAAHIEAVVEPGGTFTVQIRLSPAAKARPFTGFDTTFDKRLHDANEFYASIHREHLSSDERLVQRQAFAGLLWSKQFYHYDVHRWLSGDPTQPPPPAERWHGRNHDWALHFINADIVLMPDKWEYPWYASWDLAFQAVVMAEIDPAFAKQQLRLLTLPRSQHPYGAIPAFEWDFNAANPPLIAWAIWQIYQMERLKTGKGDLLFLKAMFEPLVFMLGWWLNRKDSDGKGIFSGGFLGLDNIGVFDRDRPLPTGGSLEQGDATGWMAMFQLNMVDIAFELALHDPRYVPMVHRFGQDFVMVASVLHRAGEGGIRLWSEEDRFYFDAIRHGTERFPLRIYSMVGLVPLFAASVMERSALQQLPMVTKTVDFVLENRRFLRNVLPSYVEPGHDGMRMLTIVSREALAEMLRRILDEKQFLSPFGIRSLSREHADNPYRFSVAGEHYEVAYLPGESDNRIFGGNSNWRGPVWFPMNFLLIQAISTFARYYDDSFTIEFPTGSGRMLTLAQVADELSHRLTRIFVRDETRDAAGRRAVFGNNDHFQHDPNWRDYVPFYEFFHGDTGSGHGASHQTGWTALVALMLQYRGQLSFSRPSKHAPRPPAPRPQDGPRVFEVATVEEVLR